jgi:hypothetical protein
MIGFNCASWDAITAIHIPTMREFAFDPIPLYGKGRIKPAFEKIKFCNRVHKGSGRCGEEYATPA